jgi:TonB family protein
MNRLQKRCVIVTAGVHLLLIVILFVGPAFFYSRPTADDIQVLDVIPANLVDAPFNSGVKDAVPPPPAPPAPPQPPQPPAKVEKVEPAKPPEKLSPDDLKPIEKTGKTEPRKNLISTQLVVRSTTKNSTAADRARQQQRARAFQAALKNLKTGFSSGAVVDMPGSGSVAYASYKDALGSIYYDAWNPEGAGNDEANTVVRITVAGDGTVINARIITPSGDEKMDASVQRTLQRVTEVPPLPDKSKVQQDFTINFNLKAKRMLE